MFAHLGNSVKLRNIKNEQLIKDMDDLKDPCPLHFLLNFCRIQSRKGI